MKDIVFEMNYAAIITWEKKHKDLQNRTDISGWILPVVIR